MKWVLKRALVGDLNKIQASVGGHITEIQRTKTIQPVKTQEIMRQWLAAGGECESLLR